MKKIFLAMLAASMVATSFAQNPKIEKEVKKAGSYEAGKALLDSQFATLTDDQKALGYNGLVELLMPAVDKTFLAVSTGQAEGKDFQSLLRAIESAVEGDKYQPNKYHKKNVDRLSSQRVILISAGQEMMNQDNNAGALPYFEAYVNSAHSSLFKEVAGDKDPNAGNVARVIAHIYGSQKEYGKAVKYAEIAMADTAARKDAEPIYFWVAKEAAKTKADTIKVIEMMKEVNLEKYLPEMAALYNRINEKEKATQLLDEAIKVNPSNYMAYAVKGENAMNERNYDVAIENFKKTVELKPDFVPVWFNLGVCASSKGYDLNDKYTDKQGKITTEHAKEVTDCLKEAITYYEKVKELDPDRKQVSNWPIQLRVLYNAVGDKAKADEISKMLGDM